MTEEVYTVRKELIERLNTSSKDNYQRFTTQELNEVMPVHNAFQLPDAYAEVNGKILKTRHILIKKDGQEFPGLEGVIEDDGQTLSFSDISPKPLEPGARYEVFDRVPIDMYVCIAGTVSKPWDAVNIDIQGDHIRVYKSEGEFIDDKYQKAKDNESQEAAN